MKLRTVLSFLFLICSLQSRGQEYEYVPFPTENASWNVDNHSSVDCGTPPGWCSSPVYWVNGDTLHLDTAYTKFHWQLHPLGITDVVFIREDTVTRKVYYRTDLSSFVEEELAYDFGVNVSDTIYAPSFMGGSEGFYHTVTSIDTVSYSGSLRKRFNLLDYGIWNSGTFWIEGIGGGNGPFQLYDQPEVWSRLRCFTDMSGLVYSEPSPNWMVLEYPEYVFCDSSVLDIIEESGEAKNNKLWIWPNPSRSEIQISIRQETKSLLEIRSFDGRIMNHSVLDGIVVIDIEDYPIGIYTISVLTTDGIHLSTKLIKL